MRIGKYLSLVIIPFVLVAKAEPTSGPTSNIRLEDAVQAIINYMAYVKENEFAADREAMLDSAPSTFDSLDHGASAGYMKDEVTSRRGEDVKSDLNRALTDFQTKVTFAGKHDNQYGQSLADIDISQFINKNKLTEDEYTAARAFVQTITNPVPKAVTNRDSADALNKHADNVIFAGISSVGLNSLHNMIAQRRVNEDTQVSMMETLEEEATFRFVDTENRWYPAIAASTQEGLLREIAIMESFRLFQNHMQYKQGERLEALLAGQNYLFGKMTEVMSELGGIIGEMSANLSATSQEMKGAMDSAIESMEGISDDISDTVGDIPSN